LTRPERLWFWYEDSPDSHPFNIGTVPLVKQPTRTRSIDHVYSITLTAITRADDAVFAVSGRNAWNVATYYPCPAVLDWKPVVMLPEAEDNAAAVNESTDCRPGRLEIAVRRDDRLRSDLIRRTWCKRR